MAARNKPLRRDPPLIKCRWTKAQTSPELASFVREDYAITISDNNDKQCSKASQPKTPGIMSTAQLISVVSNIWDSASGPLAFFQPKANLKHKDCSSQEEVIFGTLGGEEHGEVPNSAKSDYFCVDLESAGQFSSIQSDLDYLKVIQKMSAFETSCKNNKHSSFWRLLKGKENNNESWRGKGISSVEISYELENVYGWVKQIIHARLRYPKKVIEVGNRSKENCISRDNVSLVEGIMGESTSPPNNLTTANADYNSNISKPYNSSSYFAAGLESNARYSLNSDYFLMVVQDIKAESSIRTLYTDYYINLLASHSGAFEDIADDNELLENKRKEPVKLVSEEDEFKKEICSSAGGKPQYSLAKQEHAFAGALAGIFVSLCLHPVDTVKTVIQSCRAEQKSVCYIGKSIVSDRGLFGLYRGIATNVASSAPISAIYTFTYESIKGTLLPLFPKEYYPLAHCVAGGCASIATSFVFTPSERIKQQMQVGSHYNNCWNAMVGIIRKGGLPSLYAGWGAVLCRNVPHSIIKFYTYESLKQLMSFSAQPNPIQTLVCGGLAGSTAALFTTPFDVVKTRLQTQIPGSMRQYNSVIHALQEIGKNEGLRGLYRGLTPRLVMYMSQGALFFASYEFFKRVFSLEIPQSNRERIQSQRSTKDDLLLPSSCVTTSLKTSSLSSTSASPGCMHHS
ncbi:uncharacterized protein LOC107405979 [Ziziphus jujuba]|uniref:Uncharacterized protein LOC107405979 n=1 Tax=Ziziphus jujuba TaxID=326968 RepID=A0ABM3I4N1_ZIZJJ|nr:uncharacterized protein LOC107405979 [Ziziphus jujuba]XP_048320535.2 uncharacterized protein LOC107405979 [Ziziphus jujuba]